MLLHCCGVACPADAARSAALRSPQQGVARQWTHRGGGHAPPRAVVLASPHTTADDEVAEEVPETWLRVRAACASDLAAVAQLRASCFYETLREQQSLPFPSRFLPTFEREFADRELRSLQQRTQAPVGSSLACTCLVAVCRDTDAVCGCLDVSWRAGPCASTLNGVCVAEVCTCLAPLCPRSRVISVLDTAARHSRARSSPTSTTCAFWSPTDEAAWPLPSCQHPVPLRRPTAHHTCWRTCTCTTTRRGRCMHASGSPPRRWMCPGKTSRRGPQTACGASCCCARRYRCHRRGGRPAVAARQGRAIAEHLTSASDAYAEPQAPH